MKIFLKALLGAFLLVVAVVLWRTFQFGADAASPVEQVAIQWDEAVAINRLSKALGYKTISHQDQGKLDVKAFKDFQGFLKQQFPLSFKTMDVRYVAEHSLLLTWKGKTDQQPVAFLAHQDVVPILPGTLDQWTHSPWGGVVADGYIWGRGTADDKGSLMGLLEASERLISEGYTPPRTIYFAFGHDEEVGGKGAIAAAKEISETDKVRLAFVLDEGGVVAKDIIKEVPGRLALIGPAEKGYVSLKLVAKDKGGHSSMPPQHTALGRLAQAITLIENNPAPAKLEYFAETLEGLGSDQPFVNRMVFANLWLFGGLADKMLSAKPETNAGIRTTAAATMATGSNKENVLPITAEGVVNFRLIPGDTVQAVLKRTQALVQETGVEVSLLNDFYDNPSKVSGTDTNGYKLMDKVIRQVRPDTKVAPRIVVGATDARHFVDISDSTYRFVGLELGPEDLAGIHGTNERVSTESYIDAIKMYYLMLLGIGEI